MKLFCHRILLPFSTISFARLQFFNGLTQKTWCKAKKRRITSQFLFRLEVLNSYQLSFYIPSLCPLTKYSDGVLFVISRKFLKAVVRER